MAAAVSAAVPALAAAGPAAASPAAATACAGPAAAARAAACGGAVAAAGGAGDLAVGGIEHARRRAEPGGDRITKHEKGCGHGDADQPKQEGVFSRRSAS